MELLQRTLCKFFVLGCLILYFVTDRRKNYKSQHLLSVLEQANPLTKTKRKTDTSISPNQHLPMKKIMSNHQNHADRKNNYVHRKNVHRGTKSNPTLNHSPKPQPMDKCRSYLLDKLRTLKDLNVLRSSLIPNDSTFEILEFYGDAVLYERISFFIMQTRRFMSPHLLTQLRCAVIQNKNLAHVFDDLGLAALLSDPTQPLLLKGKADVVEALIGELSESCNHVGNVNAALIRGVLDELLAYICYTGERDYFLSVQSDVPVPVSDSCKLPQACNKTSASTSSSESPAPPKKIYKSCMKKAKKPASSSAISSNQGLTSSSKEFRQEVKPLEIDSTNLVNAEQTQRSPPCSVHKTTQGSTPIPVKQPPKLLLYSEIMPTPIVSTSSSSPPSPFPKALVYELPFSSPPTTSLSGAPTTPSKASVTTSPPSTSPFASNFVSTSPAGDFFSAKALLGGRSITEYNAPNIKL